MVYKGLFEYKKLGKSGPTIVALNDSRCTFSSWEKVAQSLSEHAELVLFNRFGVGASQKAEVPQVGSNIIADIFAFLCSLNIKPPFVLLAHSTGGIYANLFARMYPRAVAGIIFVDALHPQYLQEQKTLNKPWLLKTLGPKVRGFNKRFDPLRYSEEECMDLSVNELRSAGPFPSIPISVVSSEKSSFFRSSRSKKLFRDGQLKLLKLSMNAQYYACAHSLRSPQLSEPSTVIKATMDVLKELAQETRMAASY